jgi:hypothetical protein
MSDCQITYVFKYAPVMPEHRNSDKVKSSRTIVDGKDLDGGGWGGGWMVQCLATPGTQSAETGYV